MFRTLDDLKKGGNEDRDKKKEEKKKTDSYVGGGASGLSVENPDSIDKIIQRAQADSQDINAGGNKPATSCKITLYKTGFTIDDGPIRVYTDPNNQKFLAALHNGKVPSELIEKFGEEVDVDLEDKRAEEYKEPPPPKYIAYSGAGTSLGGEAPISSTVESSHQVKAEPPKVDKNKPTTRIQLRLHNGQTHEVEVNLDTKVSVIFDYTWSLAPVNGEFQLIAGFPPKPLLDVNQTVEDAGLEDSKVIQKLI